MSNNEAPVKDGDIVYYARAQYSTGIYEVCELKVRSIKGDSFIGCDKRDKHSYIFSFKNIGNYVFLNRADALKVVKEAEKHKKIFKEEDTNMED